MLLISSRWGWLIRTRMFKEAEKPAWNGVWSVACWAKRSEKAWGESRTRAWRRSLRILCRDKKAKRMLYNWQVKKKILGLPNWTRPIWKSSEFFSSNYFQIGQHVVLFHIQITEEKIIIIIIIIITIIIMYVSSVTTTLLRLRIDQNLPLDDFSCCWPKELPLETKDGLPFKNSSFSGLLVMLSAVVYLSGMILTTELSTVWR